MDELELLTVVETINEADKVGTVDNGHADVRQGDWCCGRYPGQAYVALQPGSLPNRLIRLRCLAVAAISRAMAA